MPKFRVTFSATRDLTAEEIREEYGETIGLEEDEDPFEKLVEFLDGDEYGEIIGDTNWHTETKLGEAKKGK